MRLWTLHPRYLDPQGLVALWREALLAQKVLRGLTRGYRAHPQLTRFREDGAPVGAVATYLRGVRAEALSRGYRFDASRIASARIARRLDETEGQLHLEWEHLREKLRVRSPERHAQFASVRRPEAHPLFRIIPGDVRAWEKAPLAARGFRAPGPMEIRHADPYRKA